MLRTVGRKYLPSSLFNILYQAEIITAAAHEAHTLSKVYFGFKKGAHDIFFLEKNTLENWLIIKQSFQTSWAASVV